jgi:hypothetical protein
MTPTTAKSKQAEFTALICWRGPDPAIELETRYPGFHTPREAALFAASASKNSPQGLRLSANRIDLLLGNGTYVNFPYDTMTVWILSPPEFVNHPCEHVRASHFQMHSHLALAAYRSAYGDYQPVWYAVLGPDDIPVQVTIEPNDVTLRIPELS